MAPLETLAQSTLKARNIAYEQRELEAVSLVEIDCVMTVKRLLREGSPRLQREIVNVVLKNMPLPQAA